MTGIFLLFVVIIWFCAVIWLSKFVTSNLRKQEWRIPVALVIFAVLIPLPLIDELVGGRQFEQLCEENSAIKVDRATAVGRTVYFDEQPPVEINGTWVKVVMQPHRFVDAATGEFVFSYNTLTAVGGRLIRILGISEGGMPLSFYGSCGPKESTKELVKLLGITALDRPKSNLKGR
jgi:hypothetical protein